MDLRKIDALVAEHVMGWKLTLDDYYYTEVWERPDGSTVSCGNWRPTEDIAQAWEVVEHFRKQPGVHVEVCGNPIEWCCSIFRYEGDDPSFGYEWFAQRFEPKASLAICLAALRAAGVEVPT